MVESLLQLHIPNGPEPCIHIPNGKKIQSHLQSKGGSRKHHMPVLRSLSHAFDKVTQVVFKCPLATASWALWRVGGKRSGCTLCLRIAKITEETGDNYCRWMNQMIRLLTMMTSMAPKVLMLSYLLQYLQQFHRLWGILWEFTTVFAIIMTLCWLWLSCDTLWLDTLDLHNLVY